MNDKVAIVTGSTSGIGLGVSHLLAEKDCSIILTGLGEKQVIDSLIDDFRSKYRTRVDFVPVDLRSSESIKTFCEAVIQIYPGGIDILVNNAGIQYVSTVEDYPTEKWNEMITVGLTAPFLLVKHFLPFMKKKGWGRIINMSSQMGIISAVGKSAYSAVKAGLIGFTKGVALEVAADGVTSNAICPGYAEAPVLLKQVEKIAQEKNLSFGDCLSEFVRTMNPTQHLVQINEIWSSPVFTNSSYICMEIAEMVVYLCSQAARNITGSTMVIDGGNTSR